MSLHPPTAPTYFPTVSGAITPGRSSRPVLLLIQNVSTPPILAGLPIRILVSSVCEIGQSLPSNFNTRPAKSKPHPPSWYNFCDGKYKSTRAFCLVALGADCTTPDPRTRHRWSYRPPTWTTHCSHRRPAYIDTSIVQVQRLWLACFHTLHCKLPYASISAPENNSGQEYNTGETGFGSHNPPQRLIPTGTLCMALCVRGREVALRVSCMRGENQSPQSWQSAHTSLSWLTALLPAFLAASTPFLRKSISPPPQLVVHPRTK